MTIALRNTGVNVLGEMPWGSHVCMFYESKEDLLDILAPFFKMGLECNEYCLWILFEPVTPKEARTALRPRIPGLDRHLSDGSMEIVPARDWYLDGDRIDFKRILGAWDEKLRSALAKGYDGMRVSSNPSLLRTDYWREFLEYEHTLHKWLRGRLVTAVCNYPIELSGAADVFDLARAHQLAVARRKGEWELVAPVPATLGEHSLTLREREVLWWAAQGKSARESAEMLGIAKRTVDEHSRHAIEKLHAGNRTQAVAIALRERLIGVNPPSRIATRTLKAS